MVGGGHDMQRIEQIRRSLHARRGSDRGSHSDFDEVSAISFGDKELSRARQASRDDLRAQDGGLLDPPRSVDTPGSWGETSIGSELSQIAARDGGPRPSPADLARENDHLRQYVRRADSRMEAVVQRSQREKQAIDRELAEARQENQRLTQMVKVLRSQANP